MAVVLATPNKRDAGMDLSPVHMAVAPLAIATGVWVVGNIGRERGSLWPTLVACYLAAPLYVYGYINTAGVSVIGIGKNTHNQQFST